MNNNQNNETFLYSYSAKEQEELKKIRRKYMPDEKDKMAQLRLLDKSVNNKATAWSLGTGIFGALILGGGMSLCMVTGGMWFIPGIILGIIGMAVLGVAYPLYNYILKKEREKVAPEIMRLTDELMK